MRSTALSRLSGILLASLSCSALAQTPAPGAAGRTEAIFNAPVKTAALERMRGGTQTVVNDMRLDGTTAGNTAQNIATGNNSISSGSFSNMAGIPVVVQNSGANVLIQNATIIHLQMN